MYDLKTPQAELFDEYSQLVAQYKAALAGGLSSAAGLLAALDDRFAAIANFGDRLNLGGVDVKFLGCVGDGVTDDSAAMLGAVRAAMAGGFALELGNRTYLLSTWTKLVLTGALVMHGNGATIKGPAVVTSFIGVAASVFVDGRITFDRWDYVFNFDDAATKTIAAFELSGAKFTSITTGAVYSASNIAGTLSRLVVKGCHFTSGKYGVKLALNIMKNCSVTGNLFEDVSERPVHFGWNDYTAAQDMNRFTIAHNIIRNVVTALNVGINAIIVYGFYCSIVGNVVDTLTNGNDTDAEGIYTKCVQTSIVGNVLINPGRGEAGINIKGSLSGIITSPNGFQVTCIGNVIRYTAAYSAGHVCIGIGIKNSDCIVAQNVIGGCTGDAITTGGEATRGHVTIAQNNVYGHSGSRCITIATEGVAYRITGNDIETTGASGIALQGIIAALDLDITNNTVRGATNGGVLLKPTTADMVTVRIKGNTFISCVNGVKGETAGCLALAIVDNHFDCTTKDYADGAGVTHSRFTVRDNQHTVKTTTDATLTTWLAFRMPDNSVMSITYGAVAVKSDGTDRAVYEHTQAWYRATAGNCTQQGATVDRVNIESDATWGGLSNTVSTDQMNLRQTGKAATTIRWRMNLDVDVISQS